MTKLRVVAGTDVETPKPAKRMLSRDAIYELLEPVCELFERHRQAKLEYDRAIAEVARRSGRDLRSVAGVLKVLNRKRAARLEPEDWCNLM
jgi:hypothetical protein